ncbi:MULTISPECIES: polysaccharide deacetylase family protein [Solibacillus]|uniref:Polysaccharide deacetylase family protein n=1 Tax=Solibacillus faecavium TaxID=2762221 RepID=A0ABR8Y1W7_9BACL|nr:polysaccharide deacetylase family protein [Solibacillus faecavium]MBD8038196.1 polysaccharide deacetylase family protein [Solibacillus faecavium]
MKKVITVGVFAACVLLIAIQYKSFGQNIERAVANENDVVQVGNEFQIEQATHLFEKVLLIEEAQPIYIKEKALVEIGTVQPGASFAIASEDELFYELRFGKITTFIKKGSATVEKREIQALLNKEVTGSVKADERVAVYEETSFDSAVMLQLEQGFRFPIVGEIGDWFIVKIGERAGYIHSQSVEIDEGIPVLVYHHILPKEEMVTEASTVSVESFEQQMVFLAEEQFETITTAQLYDYLEGRQILSTNSVLITFDDGLLSTKEYAYPILKKHGFTAVQHIISSRTNRYEGEQVFNSEGPLQFFTEYEMEQLADVFYYEAHTDGLHRLNSETGLGVALELSASEIAADLKRNVATLKNATSLAYPFGHYNEEMAKAMKEVGLLIGFTTNEGYANIEQSNYEVNRFGVTEKKTYEQFTSYVKGVF